MDDNNYTTGSWLGLVRHGAVVVLEAGTDPAILDHLWHFLGRQPTIHGLLHEVTEQFGTGLVDLPCFAILLHHERLHAILRGDITLAAHTGDGIEIVSGRDVTTWSERSLLLPESLELTLADGPEPAMVLPVAEAVVRLQSLRLSGISPGSAKADGLRDDAGLPASVPPAALTVADHAAGAGAAGDPDFDEEDPDFGPDEEDPAVDESFALAADAEWNAQLAPVDEPGAPVETDLGLTIRPDNSEDELDELAEQGEPFAAGPAGSEPAGGDPADAARDLAEDGFTTNYDFLFGATVAQNVQDAAVRLDGEGQPLAQGSAAPIVPPLPTQPPQAGNKAAARAAELPSEPQAQSHPAEAPYDPDHDGHTVLRREAAGDSEPETETILASRPPTGPMVLARVCPNGHANPPRFASCFSCGAAVVSEPRTVGRPRLGTMHISSGEVVELDHSLIIGRQPSVSRVMGQAMPRLVQVKSGNDDISRSHVEVRLEGWDVLLVDLKSTNGTVLVREGQAPRRLGQGEEAILLNGDIAELGDGVTLLFDGLL